MAKVLVVQVFAAQWFLFTSEQIRCHYWADKPGRTLQRGRTDLDEMSKQMQQWFLLLCWLKLPHIPLAESATLRRAARQCTYTWFGWLWTERCSYRDKALLSLSFSHSSGFHVSWKERWRDWGLIETEKWWKKLQEKLLQKRTFFGEGEFFSSYVWTKNIGGFPATVWPLKLAQSPDHWAGKVVV